MNNRKLAYLGYFLVFLGSFFLDQTTKLHAERNLMEWSSPTDSRSFHSNSHPVFHWGTSPAAARSTVADNAPVVNESKNWLDFNLTYIRNHGAVWGSFSDLPESFRHWFFLGVTIAASFVILHLFRSSHPAQKTTRIALAMVLAGAAGNFCDRVLLRYVIDWIHFHWKIFGWEYSFPVFNWADVSINIGVGLLIIEMICLEKSSAQTKSIQS